VIGLSDNFGFSFTKTAQDGNIQHDFNDKKNNNNNNNDIRILFTVKK